MLGVRARKRPAVEATAPEGTFLSLGDSCAIRESGEIACWGGEHWMRDMAPPAGRYRSVSAGDDHACAIRESGEIECWGDTHIYWWGSDRSGSNYPAYPYEEGDNNHGQLDAPAGSYRSVTVGLFHTCAIGESGEISCWGGNRLGETDAPPGNYELLRTSGHQSCAIRESGEIDCWGPSGDFLGIATGEQPTGSDGPPPGRFQDLQLGYGHACALRQSGEIACWGDNTWGQAAAPPGKFSAVSVGALHACGIRESGEIECWGGLSVPPALR